MFQCSFAHNHVPRCALTPAPEVSKYRRGENDASVVAALFRRFNFSREKSGQMNLGVIEITCQMAPDARLQDEASCHLE
jgi:hypothetical protein